MNRALQRAASQDGPWVAELTLCYGRRGERTVPTERRHVGPLRVLKYFHPERDGLLQHIVVHPPGGVASGDELRVELALDAGAEVQLTTPGATSWYRARGGAGEEAGPAVQRVRAVLGAGAVLEWLPQATIVFDGARADVGTLFELAEDARLVAWDVVALGRRAGERPFATGTLRYQTRVERGGRLLYSERLGLDAADPLRESPLGLGGADVFGSLLVAAPDVSGEVLAACRAEAAGDGQRAGITQLPGLLVARFLGTSTEAAHGWFRRLWTLLRPPVLGRVAVPLRTWST